MICAVADGAAVAAGGVDDDCDDDRSDDAAADRNHDHRIVDRDSLAYDVELAVAVVVAVAADVDAFELDPVDPGEWSVECSDD